MLSTPPPPPPPPHPPHPSHHPTPLNHLSTTRSPTHMKGGSNVLSQKVARALQVQTDTPAMTAALEALSNLPSSSSSTSSPSRKNTIKNETNNKGNGKEKNVIDARSVRAVIEQDALQQAILFQMELKRLVQTVSDLKGSVTEIKVAATRVSAAIEADVVCSPSEAQFDQQESNNTNTKTTNPSSDTATTSGEDKTETEAEKNDNSSTRVKSKNIVSGVDSLQDEENLASIIADAFRARNEAAYRANTVKKFLEKFDLDDNDNYLLDHYAFEEFQGYNIMEDNTNNDHNGTAFLQALQRVRNIREQLKITFDTETFVRNHTDDNEFSLDSDFEKLNPHQPKSSYSYNRLGATSALRMMETLATKQERAYERLYNWLQSYLQLNDTALKHVPTSSAMQQNTSGSHKSMQRRSSSNMDNDDDDLMDEALSHPFVKDSLFMLKYMPAYYNHILELIAMQRRSEVTRRFLLALTAGYNGMTPIEMRAHDPLNYVGDMLAFIFRAFSVELDLARATFSLDDTKSSIIEDEENNNDFNEDDEQGMNINSNLTATSLLSHAMSGVTRPLKSRISQVVASLARRMENDENVDGRSRQERRLMRIAGHNEDGEEGADIDVEATSLRNRISALYSITGLLLFYQGALQKSAAKLTKFENNENEGVENKESKEYLPIIETIEECLEEASNAYAASVRVYGAMLGSFAALTSSESESTLVNTIIIQISDVRVTSPGFPGDKKTESTLSIDFLCDTLINSAILSCSTLEDVQSLKNALIAAKKAGLSTNRYDHWEKLLRGCEVQVFDDFIRAETDNVLDQCGLGSVWEEFQRVEKDSDKDDEVLKRLFASQPGLTQDVLQSAMKNFYASLYSPPLPSFDNMKDPTARKNARIKIAANVSNIYRRIYEGVTSERGGYNDLSFMGHHPDQVKTLLSL